MIDIHKFMWYNTTVLLVMHRERVTGVLIFSSIAVRTSVYGGVEQLVARKAHNLEVVGSSPTFRTHGDKSSILVLFGV